MIFPELRLTMLPKDILNSNTKAMQDTMIRPSASLNEMALTVIPYPHILVVD